jgi:hypothetical protein
VADHQLAAHVAKGIGCAITAIRDRRVEHRPDAAGGYRYVGEKCEPVFADHDVGALDRDLFERDGLEPAARIADRFQPGRGPPLRHDRRSPVIARRTGIAAFHGVVRQYGSRAPPRRGVRIQRCGGRLEQRQQDPGRRHRFTSPVTMMRSWQAAMPPPSLPDRIPDPAETKTPPDCSGGVSIGSDQIRRI